MSAAAAARAHAEKNDGRAGQPVMADKHRTPMLKRHLQPRMIRPACAFWAPKQQQKVTVVKMRLKIYEIGEKRKLNIMTRGAARFARVSTAANGKPWFSTSRPMGSRAPGR